MSVEITNAGNEVLTLPFPYQGILGAGESLILGATLVQAQATFGLLPQTGGFKLTDLPTHTGPVGGPLIQSRQTVGPWIESVFGGNSDQPLWFQGLNVGGSWVAPRDGCLRAWSANVSVAPNAALSVQVFLNGNPMLVGVAVPTFYSGGPTELFQNFSWGQFPFVTGDIINPVFTSGGGLNNNPQLWVTLEIQM